MFNRFKDAPKFQVKSIRAPLSYSNEWQAQMFTFHPSKGFFYES